MPRNFADLLQALSNRIDKLERRDRNREAVTLGDWTVRENDAGNLVAVHENGTTRIVAERG